MHNNKNIVLVCFSGMGLGKDFIQIDAPRGVHVVCPEYPKPCAGESFIEYSHRVAKIAEAYKPTYLAGVSFGAAIALEAALLLGPGIKGVIIIAGPASPKDLSWHFRIFRNVHPLIIQRTTSVAFSLADVAFKWLGNLLSNYNRSFLEYFLKADRQFINWALPAFLKWTPPCEYNSSCSIYRIHGNKDPIFKYHSGGIMHIIPNGKHIITVTHMAEVNRLINDYLCIREFS